MHIYIYIEKFFKAQCLPPYIIKQFFLFKNKNWYNLVFIFSFTLASHPSS